jgi:hypothetical protein
MNSSSNLLHFEVLAEAREFFLDSSYTQIDRWKCGIHLARKEDGSGWVNHEQIKDNDLYVKITYPSLFNPTIKVVNTYGYDAWECDTANSEVKAVIMRWSGFVFIFDINTQVFSVRKINVIPRGSEVLVIDREIFMKKVPLSSAGNFLVKNLDIPTDSFLNEGNFAVYVRWMCSIASHQQQSLVKSRAGIV